jgi:hypothetical protein
MLRGIYNKYTGEERFWSKVKIGNDDECWEWQGSTHKGYGKIKIENKWETAHRIAWELSRKRKILDKKEIGHHCDKPLCCNPKHLFLCTHQGNMNDMVRKCRQKQAKGVYKLSDRQVCNVRRIYKLGLCSQVHLAKYFNVSEIHIWNIIHYHKRKNIVINKISN